jgi:signal transduction histidine kinase
VSFTGSVQPIAPVARPETYRVLGFLLTGLLLGAVSLALLLGGWAIAVAISFTPLVIPVLIGIAAVTRMLATAERALAKHLLGVALEPRAPTRAEGFWGRGWAMLTDRAMWKEQAYLLLRFFIGVVALAPLAWAVQSIIAPLTYRWGADSGFWQPDTLSEALIPCAVGVVVLLLALQLMPIAGALSRRLAWKLLSGDHAPRRTPAETRAARRRALAVHAALTIGAGVVLVVVWATTTQGYFWPVWALLPLGMALAIHAWVMLVLERPGIRQRTGGSEALAAHLGVSVALWGFLVAVWALTGHGYFWPIWPLLGFAVLLIFHAVVLFGRHKHRIDVLETSRAGAVDVQEADLRRIERDLHDGAQARLVALGMNIGMAEQKLQADPESARELLAEARRGAQEALEELRDLARGIHPPVLTDRGLEAAVAALVADSPMHTTLTVDVPERPAAAVETAAYFVVAEAVANAGKHAQAAQLDIRLGRTGDVLTVEVVDDGRGGADPSGDGLSGLRRRVDALDGTLNVTSPEGGPTTIRAELPCGS